MLLVHRRGCSRQREDSVWATRCGTHSSPGILAALTAAVGARTPTLGGGPAPVWWEVIAITSSSTPTSESTTLLPLPPTEPCLCCVLCLTEPELWRNWGSSALLPGSSLPFPPQGRHKQAPKWTLTVSSVHYNRCLHKNSTT